MITKRDQDIINFLEEFHTATTKQLRRLFFSNTSYRYATKRLEYLYKQGFIKRTVSTIDNCIAYYIGQRPSQLHHDLIRTELYSQITIKYNVLEWQNERPIDNVRPDAVTFIDDHGIIFPVFVEVHLNNKFNFDKYLSLEKNNDLKTAFKLFPRVLLCTDRQVTIPRMNIKFKIVDLQMNGLDNLFKQA